MRGETMGLKIRLTIGQVMIATAVIALALAPLGPVLRTQKAEWVVATVAYEVIFLPALTCIILLMALEPGKARDLSIAFLCSLPVLLIIAIGLAGYLYSVAVSGYRYLVHGARSESPLFVGFVFIVLYSAIHHVMLPRCPACRATRLRQVNRPWSEGRPPSEMFRCGRCGARFKRLRWTFHKGPLLRMADEKPESSNQPPKGS
jgi:hypothetical protein